MKKLLLTLSAVLMTFSVALAVTATRVTSATDLKADTKYVIVGYNKSGKKYYAMTTSLSNGYFGNIAPYTGF